jgi:hypothetical protein
MTDRPQQHGLKFYEKSHRYKLDGEWVPGVTTIIKDAVPAPALMKWSAKAVAQYVAANRETVERLWTMGEQATTNALKEVPCADFIDDWNIRPVLVEACVGSREHQYAGKLDLVADSNRAPRAIFDWKTAASGIFFETAFQCVGYGFAEFHGEDGNESPMTDLNIEAAFGVHLRADGYDVYPLRYGKDVFDEFVALRCHAAVLKRAKGDWKNPGSGYVGRAVNPDLEGVVA